MNKPHHKLIFSENKKTKKNDYSENKKNFILKLKKILYKKII
jgi:hypothetical protein